MSGFRASAAKDYGGVPSDKVRRDAVADELASGRPIEVHQLDGLPGFYRLGFVGMPISGMPERFRCGRVLFTQEVGPIETQSTYIVQRPGWIPRFDKTMHRGPVEVGDGLILTLCALPVVMPANEHVGVHLDAWRDEVRAAAAMVAVLLDDRVAQQEVLEDVVIFDSTGAQPISMLDTAVRVRDFPPTKAVTGVQRAGLDKLAAWNSEGESAEHVAARWYLRAAQAGPTPDSIVYLWIALEALIPARGKGRSTDVSGVEDALREAGADPTQWTPSVGRCAGIRGEIVHHGKEQPKLLSDGYYSLEAMVRLLLRHRLGVDAEAWPLNIQETNLKRPFRKVAERLKVSRVK